MPHLEFTGMWAAARNSSGESIGSRMVSCSNDNAPGISRLGFIPYFNK